MYNVIFYILLILILSAGIIIAFGRNNISSAFSLYILLISSSGVYVMLNSELFGLINILIVAGITILLLISFPGIRDLTFLQNTEVKSSGYISTAILGLLTALVSSLVSSTRWHSGEISYDFNSFTLIFTKYLPVIIFLAVTASVMLPLFALTVKKEAAND